LNEEAKCENVEKKILVGAEERGKLEGSFACKGRKGPKAGKVAPA